MAANDDLKKSNIIMSSLLTFRYISTVQVRFFSTSEVFWGGKEPSASEV